MESPSNRLTTIENYRKKKKKKKKKKEFDEKRLK